MATVAAKLTWNQKEINALEENVMIGLLRMAADIAARARKNAPVVTSALRNSIRWEPENHTTVYIKAGGILAAGTPKNGKNKGATIMRNVDYALKRERGPNRDPTTEHYMENAQKSIMTGNYLNDYFGGITQ